MDIIADGLLMETLIRANTFGVTLVKLDIRQSSDKHIELLNAITEYLEARQLQVLVRKSPIRFLITGTQYPLGH